MAALGRPAAITVDAAGNILFAETVLAAKNRCPNRRHHDHCSGQMFWTDEKRGLKQQLESELPDSRLAGASNRPERGAVHRARRVAEIDAVEEVEKLRAQLELKTLPQRDALENARIHVHEIGTAQHSLAHVAEAALK